MSTFYLVFFIVFLLFLFVTLVYFWRDTDGYVENMQSIRKTYYVLFIFAITIGIMREEIKLDDWQLLLQFGALFVFVDIAVFQTPDVLKIWNTEFQHSNYIRKTIRKNEEVLGYNLKKVKNFTQVISDTNPYLSEVQNPEDWDAYQREMRKYLKRYTDTFQFHVSIFPFDINENDDELRRNVATAFNKVEMRYNFEVADEGWKNEMIESLLDGRSIQLSQKEEDKNPTTEDRKKKAFIIAYYGVNYNMLIGLNSSNNVEVDGIDASHILNMANIFDWHMA